MRAIKYCRRTKFAATGDFTLEKFIIKGGRRLEGEVEISGAKNAVVAIIPAVILADGPCVLENIPNISDVSISLRILYEMGADVQKLDKNTYRIDAGNIKDPVVPYELARHMRASYYFLGTLLGKFGRARMKYLKEYQPGLYSRLLLSGKLYDDLREVDAEA